MTYILNPGDPYQPAYLLSKHFAEIKAREAIWYSARHNFDEGALGDVLHLQSIVRKNRPFFLLVNMHPGVEQALKELGRPRDWHLLVLECPQYATDNVRVAYVRNEMKRKAHYEDREGNKHLTATTLSKYLTRHWPHIKSDKIRNLCEAFQGEFGITDDLDKMIEIVTTCKATSCMSDADDYRDGFHPYQAYDPKYGWKLAYEQKNGVYVGRALVNDEVKCFVRTYGKEGGGYTQSHVGLQHWLEQQGYEYADEWPEGVKFAKVEYLGTHIAPYLDPGPDRIASSRSRKVSDKGGFLVRDDQGPYTWDTTNGTPSEAEDEDEDMSTCDECGESYPDDEVSYLDDVGSHVCDCCRDERYTIAYGRRGHRYWASNDSVVEVDGNYYHVDWLSDNEIVELHDGDYAKYDDAVFVEDYNEYYLGDDVATHPDETGCVVYVDSDSEYHMRDDCEWCVYNEEWFKGDDVTEVSEGVHVRDEDVEDYILGMEDIEKAREAMEFTGNDLMEEWEAEHRSRQELEAKRLAVQEAKMDELIAQVTAVSPSDSTIELVIFEAT